MKTALRCGFTTFVVVVVVILVSAVVPTEGIRGCSKLTRVLDRVPVHSRFNIERFLGTWYTIKQASTDPDDDVVLESASMDISKNPDGSLSYSITGKIGDDPCLPVESGSMRRQRRPGQFVMQGTSMTKDDPTFIVSFTNYNMALVYYCVGYQRNRLGQCQKGAHHVEIISRTADPSEKELKDYVRRMQRRLCAKSDLIRDTVPGACEIPDILAAAKQDKVSEEEGSDDTNRTCAVNNIKVQETFSMSQMDGIWYEIARTRLTFNTMESVISAHKYVPALQEIHSYYTGTINGSCLTAIQGMSKQHGDGLSEGDMVGRIGGAESTYPWAPMKVLYADDNYLLFYACYSGATDTPCARQGVEVTLVGRSRDIDPELQTAIYANLRDVCLEPELMVPTEFEANCSKWVEAEIKNAGLHPSDCPVDLISNRTDFDIFDNDEMLGEWYGYAGKNYGAKGTLMGVVMNITSLSNDAFLASTIGYTSGTSLNCTLQTDTIMRERCLYMGEFVVSDEEGHLAFSSVPFMSDNTLVLYTCTDRNLQGTCEPDGVSVYVFTRNGTMSEETREIVDETLRHACINPTDLIRVDSDPCSIIDILPMESPTNLSCDIDNVVLYNDMDDFEHLQLRGLWYLFGELTKQEERREAVVAYVTTDEHNVLQFFSTEYSGGQEDGACQPVEHMFATPRCKSSVDGDYIARREGNETTGYTPYKVIYTDYTGILMTYSCAIVKPDGVCEPGTDNVEIWSRNQKPKASVIDYATYWLEDYCLTTYKIQRIRHRRSCLAELTSYVEENELSYDDYYDEQDEDDFFDDFEDDEEDYQSISQK